jgi:hypothetical protein
LGRSGRLGAAGRDGLRPCEAALRRATRGHGHAPGGRPVEQGRVSLGVGTWGDNRPASFGPLGRGWPERLRFAGTYDQAWNDDVFPFLPRDFDPRHYQASPADQQIPFPAKGTEVLLANLTPEGNTAFRLPEGDLPVHFVRARDGVARYAGDPA